MKSICVFGDSISKGVILDAVSERYSTTKKSFVNLLSGCEPWMNITNYSMFGCTVTKGKNLIDRHNDAVEHSDAILLEYGGNDCDFDWASIAETPAASHLPKTPPEVFAEQYREIVLHLIGMGKRIIMLNLPPIDEKKYFSWFANGLNGDNIVKWLGGDIHYIYEYHSGYNKKLSEIAAEFNLPLIDIRSEFLRQADYSSLLCLDGIHPNEKGHELIAQTIESCLPAIYISLAAMPA
jgi:lysophospholipase L1-like esterase